MQIIENYLQEISQKDNEFIYEGPENIATGAGEVAAGTGSIVKGGYKILTGIIGRAASSYIGRLGIAALLGAIARELYVRNGQCKKLAGGLRAKCLLDSKYRAYVAKINLLEKSISRCNRTTDPLMCRKIIKKELDEAREEAAQLRG